MKRSDSLEKMVIPLNKVRTTVLGVIWFTMKLSGFVTAILTIGGGFLLLKKYL